MRKPSTGSRIFVKRTAMWRKGWGTQSYWNLKRASASRACGQTPVPSKEWREIPYRALITELSVF
jgi:hypothetical protein